MIHGQYWYGKNFPGFFYKKNGGAGLNKSTKMAPGGNTICNHPSDLENKYIPGSGVGASPVAIRRLKKNRASFNCCQSDVLKN